MPWRNFKEQSIYSRREDIHVHYRGQEQGGISTPARHPVVFAFTGQSGQQHGYDDGWTADGTYRYFGEGQLGPMEFKGGNLAIRDHLKNGEDLLLFETLGKGKGVRFIGQFDCAGYTLEEAPNREGVLRQAIVFELVPFGSDQQAEEVASEAEDGPINLGKLRMKAFNAAQSAPQLRGTAARRNLYKRANLVRRYVLARGAGLCECCSAPAPFRTAFNEPYLEPHHIRRLSDGGPDDPRFMAAICPNCHREIHHGVLGQDKNVRLQEIIRAKEGV